MRNIRIIEPSKITKDEIEVAKKKTINQRRKIIICPYCRFNLVFVFEDATGHIQAKCKYCGRETIFNLSTSAKAKY